MNAGVWGHRREPYTILTSDAIISRTGSLFIAYTDALPIQSQQPKVILHPFTFHTYMYMCVCVCVRQHFIDAHIAK